MAYVSSNNNRFYVALEQDYGSVAAIAGVNRIPAVKLTVKQVAEKVQRKDKTGSRTFVGVPPNMRKTTSFDLTTYMSSWTDPASAPAQGNLFQAGLGAPPILWAGGTAATPPDPLKVTLVSAHGLAPGQAISNGGEIRFVAAVVNANTIQLNAPFSNTTAGATLGPTITYQPASDLGSLSIFDYWTPGTAVQRILSGAAVNQIKIKVNGDFHEFQFSGQASDVLDSSSFESGAASLTSFPVEPAAQALDSSIVPGHLGQIWLGSVPNQFFTVTKAQLSFDNGVDLRANEFGSTLPRAIAPGERSVTFDFSLFQQDDSTTQALYQAARQKSPISVMVQLGQQQGELFGIYMNGVMLEVPEFDDSETRQQWQFRNNRAQGIADDEIYLAFA
jgi:hypothetical protein